MKLNGFIKGRTTISVDSNVLMACKMRGINVSATCEEALKVASGIIETPLNGNKRKLSEEIKKIDAGISKLTYERSRRVQKLNAIKKAEEKRFIKVMHMPGVEKHVG